MHRGRPHAGRARAILFRLRRPLSRGTGHPPDALRVVRRVDPDGMEIESAGGTTRGPVAFTPRHIRQYATFLEYHVDAVFVEPLDAPWGIGYRSEEHTSELQSLMRISYAVLLLK